MKTWTRLAGVLAGLALLIPVSACATQDNPAVVAQEFLQAMAKADTKKACKLAADENGSFAADDREDACVAYLDGVLQMESARAEMTKYANAKVTNVQVEGDKASVSPDDIDGVIDPQGDLDLVRIADRWYVEADFG